MAVGRVLNKTVNDPCSYGYRIPPSTVWQSVIANNNKIDVGTWSINAVNYTSGKWFGAELLLPASGFRYAQDGLLYNRGGSGYYRSSSADNSTSYSLGLYMLGGTAEISNLNRHDGYSVRCVAELSGAIGSFHCDSVLTNGSLTVGLVAENINVSVPYSGDGNVGLLDSLFIVSTGVTGLTATLPSGNIY
jgi:hypothetical protein